VQKTTQTSNRWLKRAPALLFLAALSFLYFWFTRFKAPQHLDISTLALTTPSGSLLPATMYRDKAIILNFWAPWCGPCNLEAPWLQAVQDAHPQDLLVIGINDDPDTNDQMAEFAFRNGVRYPLVTKTSQVHDAVGALAGVPTTLYIDRTGRVVHTISGVVPRERIEQFTQDALKH
jgi:thiol-disulfide isomerase/thioredoxin